LQTVVTEIAWRAGRVVVRARSYGEDFEAHARAVVVTVPLGILQREPPDRGAIAFVPQLPEQFAHALRGLAMGPVVKAVLLFRESFWERLDDGRLAQTGFFRAAGGAFPTVWTQLPIRVPTLTFWAGGPVAERFSDAGPQAIIDKALASLRVLFPSFDARGELETGWAHDWRFDEFARGAYSYVLVGGSDARKLLGIPIERTLFFAGEAAAPIEEAGTVAGALESGARAAREILAGS